MAAGHACGRRGKATLLSAGEQACPSGPHTRASTHKPEAMQCPHPIKAEAVFKFLTSLSFLSGTGVCFLMLFPV